MDVLFGYYNKEIIKKNLMAFNKLLAHEVIQTMIIICHRVFRALQHSGLYSNYFEFCECNN